MATIASTLTPSTQMSNVSFSEIGKAQLIFSLDSILTLQNK
jgi:hypothetical protein